MNSIETKSKTSVEDYKAFATDLVQKQMVIIGPKIALDKAVGVPGLSVNDQGEVVSISGDPYLTLKNLIDDYSLLTHIVTHAILCRLIEKYPILKEDFSRAINKIELSCPIEL